MHPAGLPTHASCSPRPLVPQQRTVGDAVLLEASLENATRAPMLLDAISFFPSPPWAAERIGGGGAATLPPPAQTTGGSAAAQAGPLRCVATSAAAVFWDPACKLHLSCRSN